MKKKERTADGMDRFLEFCARGFFRVFRGSLRMACRVALTDPISVFRDGARKHCRTQTCAKSRRAARISRRCGCGGFVRVPALALRRGGKQRVLPPFRLGGGGHTACAPHLRVYGEGDGEINFCLAV